MSQESKPEWQHGKTSPSPAAIGCSPRAEHRPWILEGVACVLLLVLTACSGRVEEEALPFQDVSQGEAFTATNATLPNYSAALAGSSEASWCAGDGRVQIGRIEAGVDELTRVSLYQGVEIALGNPGSVDVVAGRDALIRVFVDPRSGPLDGAVLRLESDGGGIRNFEDVRPLQTATSPGGLGSAYRFFIPGDLIEPNTRLSTRLFRQGRCDDGAASAGGARFPATGSFPLEARQVGGLQVVAIPITYAADGSQRVAGIGPENLLQLGRHLEALAPVASVEVTLHEPLLTTERSLEQILAELMHLRSLERPPSQTIYFGFVRPADSMNDYCHDSCVAGVSAVGSASGHGSTGIGVAFESTMIETFVHEVGHILRLEHAPCGGPTGVDPDYPHPDARLGTWGFDMRTALLIDPASSSRDFMSYCDPTWISDFNYQSLLDRIAFSNAQLWSDVVQPGESKPPIFPSDGDFRPLGGSGPAQPAAFQSQWQSEESVEFVSCRHQR